MVTKLPTCPLCKGPLYLWDEDVRDYTTTLVYHKGCRVHEKAGILDKLRICNDCGDFYMSDEDERPE